MGAQWELGGNAICSNNGGCDVAVFSQFSVEVTELKVTSRTATSLTIAWKVSVSVDKFVITAIKKSTKCSKVFTVTDGFSREYTLTDLEKDSVYDITVEAIRNAGSGVGKLRKIETSASGECLYRKQTVWMSVVLHVAHTGLVATEV